MVGKTEYKNNWQKENVDRINLTVPKGQKETIQAHAAAQSESVNGFIKRAIEEAMDQDAMDSAVFTVQIKCPNRTCGHVWSEDMSDYVQDSMSYDRPMGDEIEHTIEADVECPNCGRNIAVTGSIWEYPVGAQNYVDIRCEPEDQP